MFELLEQILSVGFDDLLDIILLIALSLYLVYSIVHVTINLVRDLYCPYLGVASTYLFNYFILCLFAVSVPLLSTDRFGVNRLTEMFILLITIATYNGCIYLIKRFIWDNPINEARFTLLLTFLMTTSIIITVSVFRTVPVQEFSGTWSEGSWLIMSAGICKPIQREILFLCRMVPLSLVMYLWFISLNKGYNTKSKSFFVKAMNRPIFCFIIYQVTVVYFLITQTDSLFFKLLLVMGFFWFKLRFVKSILDVLRSPSMEAIETVYEIEAKNSYRRFL